MNQKSIDINRILAMLLRAGSALSVVLMAAGMALALAADGGLEGQRAVGLGFFQVIAGVMELNPPAVMTLGILVLLFTPFLRVIGAFLSFLLIEKDIKYSLISFGVLLIMTLSLLVPGLH
ncbi:hypothetical protein Tfer_2031 [Thermincola ferriacetica]|uniref:DUF1634 domain-containing protein n=1 Tax=Thermincola ferriacetica TaxID=281456 RepID=A0A0L6W1D9_9FIRM|nr:DUF1634 domain-containing protein [Thermincola ferriacetica]KNZ69392.1 hypothetical protein Tfer_2031 [Thermincola ferriacetica]